MVSLQIALRETEQQARQIIASVEEKIYAALSEDAHFKDAVESVAASGEERDVSSSSGQNITASEWCVAITYVLG